MTIATFKLWYRVHKWTSLICTAFMLMLCVTGLPLIFHDELEHWLGSEITPAEMPTDTPNAPIERVMAAGLEAYPGLVVQYVVWDRDDPDTVLLNLAATRPAPRGTQRIVVVDARTAEVLGEKKIYEGVLYVLRQLHKDMFAGLAGSLFLGFMGLLFVVAVVTGALVYGPFMRKLDFGTVRRSKSARLKWLDLHNLLGIVTLTWVLVVGATGIINTWAELLINLWRADQIASMASPYRSNPAPSTFASIDSVMAAARAATPGMSPAFVAFPGMPGAGKNHFFVAMRGESALTERLLKPVSVDAATGALTDVREPPWYMTALLLSQPLHFGDYGGLPLKIVWALLDIITIMILGSGLYIWLVRRKSPIEVRLAEREQADALAATSGRRP